MNEITKLYHEWIELQPLNPEYKKRLDEKFMLEFNYNSNHIEGNTLTYGQTKLLLMFGKTEGIATLRDYEEMKAHNVGLEIVKREALDKERPLTELFIRELNRVILVDDFKKQRTDGEGTYEIKVGQYKTKQNSVITATGEEFQYASPEETPAMMTDLVSWYNQEEKNERLTLIEIAALLHYRYIRIHPFEDGNGRIARLLVNFVLLRHGYPMIIIKSDDKQNYLNILNVCDVTVGLIPSDGANAKLEDIQPFVDYINDVAKQSLVIAIKAAKGENIDEKDDWKKKLSLKVKETKDAPLFSEKLAKEANSQSFLSSFLIINDELKPFYTLFDNVIYADNNNSIFTIESIKSYNWNTKRNIISLILQKFLVSKGRLEFRFDFKIVFQNQSYKLEVKIPQNNDSNMEMEFRYGEDIEIELISEFASFIGTQLSDFVIEKLN